MRPIDADALKKELCKDCLAGYCTRECYEVHLIKAQPTIEAEPVRRGRWVDHQYKEFPVGRYECSVCGARHDMPWDYCPNCGAKMEEEE